MISRIPGVSRPHPGDSDGVGARPPPAQEVFPTRGAGLGTFGGVFTPSILTILGVIMYLRFGWVVGNVGLLGTLAIVTLSTSITFLTALSISAIATDQRVRVGGAYYMVRRASFRHSRATGCCRTRSGGSGKGAEPTTRHGWGP